MRVDLRTKSAGRQFRLYPRKRRLCLDLQLASVCRLCSDAGGREKCGSLNFDDASGASLFAEPYPQPVPALIEIPDGEDVAAKVRHMSPMIGRLRSVR